MATQILRALRAAGGDYSTVQDWVADIPVDMVAADEQWTLEVYDDWPGGLNVYGVDIDKVVNTDCFPEIIGVESHSGDRTVGAFFAATATTSPFYMLRFSCQKFRYADMRLSYQGTPGRFGFRMSDNATEGMVERNIFIKPAAGAQVLALSAAQGCVTRANIIYSDAAANAATAAIQFERFYSGVFEQNTLIITSGIAYRQNGFSDTTDSIVRQNVFYTDTLADNDFTTTPNWTDNAFKSGIDLARGANPILDVTDADFVDPAANDWTPAPGQKLAGTGQITPAFLDLKKQAYTGPDIGCLTIAGGAPSYSITGDVTTTFTPAATLLYTPASYAISGDVNTTFTPEAALLFVPFRGITGDVTTTFTPSAALQYTPGTIAITGSVVTTFTPAAALQFTAPEFSITGSVTTTFTPAADLRFTPRQVIVGSVVTTFTPEAALLFTQRGLIDGDVLTQFIPQAVLQFRTPLTGRPRMFNAGAAPTIFSVRE